MRKLFRKFRNAVYRSVIKRLWKGYVFRLFVIDEAINSPNYDLRYTLGQLSQMTEVVSSILCKRP